MAKSTNPIPPGFHTVTPYLVLRDARKAIDFYKAALGAEEILVMPGPGGRTMHAEIKIGDSVVFLSDECPEMNHLGPESRGGTTCSLMLYVKDVDSSFDKAVKAGCTVKMPLNDQFWGDRFGKLVDPFGHEWAMATHIEDVSPEEMKQRAEEASKQMATAGKK
jgi:PhnB protein